MIGTGGDRLKLWVTSDPGPMNENSSALSPLEARRIVRRHVHDLRNIANYVDLEATLLAEDFEGTPARDTLEKVRDQLAHMETVLRALAVRFGEPAIALVAAADVYFKWSSQMKNLRASPNILWSEARSNSAIHIDFNAILAVLREICVLAGRTTASHPITAKMLETADSVTFEIREIPEHLPMNVSQDGSQEVQEWKRIVEISGGELSRKYEPTDKQWVTALTFQKTV